MADTIIAAISLAFMAAIAFLGYRLYRENQFFLSSLSDRHRGLLYGAIGVIFATFVATDRLLGHRTRHPDLVRAAGCRLLCSLLRLERIAALHAEKALLAGVVLASASVPCH